MKLNTIAQQLKLSQSTVSRALNDYQDISADTKALVRKAASELGYVPNPHARRLASGKADNIAYVMPRSDGQFNSSFLSELMAGMAEKLNAKGWDLSVLVPNSAEEEIEIFQKISRTRHVSGLIISRTLTHDARFKILHELKIPFVSHGRSMDSGTAAWIDVDNVTAFYDMTTHFIELGHRRIAYIGGEESYNFSAQRARGWRDALVQARITLDPDLHQKAELSYAGGAFAMQNLLMLAEPPTAVCCISDHVAIGAMRALRDCGLVPGREVSVIGYDGLEIGNWLEPPLSTMKQPLQSAGQQLVEIIINMVENGDSPEDHQKLYRATLVRRGTDNPPVLGWPKRLSKSRHEKNTTFGGEGK
jgi:LacI family transcriptional regulator